MQQFDELLAIADRLLGPNGCPWDKKQTFHTLQQYIIEEAHELVEAVDKSDAEEMKEELGDLLYNIIFYSKLAEMEKKFTMQDVVETIKEKLIRRHPHIFGDTPAASEEEVVKRWEEIKKTEKGEARKSRMDGIPSTLPALIRAQKIVKRIVKAKSPLLSQYTEEGTATEHAIGEEMVKLALKAERSGIDLESALRRTLGKYEEEFRAWEENRISL